MSAEKILQSKYNTKRKASNFEKTQKIDYLNQHMINFVSNQELMFVATSDKNGNCDNSIRAGKKGFIKVINSKKIMYPEYRGNGIFASLGNIEENPHIGLLLIDFYESTIGLHINGKAKIINSANKSVDPLAERWVEIDIEEAYIHCSKHIPLLKKMDKTIYWNTDNSKHKGGNHFDI
ncbi:MAG: putative pyridoxine 5'-phosphate oxidase superfamily flavin-nucleotide-binding protein [Planctomycetota bacterium]|jgi:uncharacterized protein